MDGWEVLMGVVGVVVGVRVWGGCRGGGCAGGCVGGVWWLGRVVWWW